MLIPPRIITQGLGGFGNDLTSTKWSFFNFATSSNVSSRLLLASSTAASAVLANSYASAVYFEAIASSTETIFWVSSASFLSISSLAITYSVSIAAYSSSGCILISMTYMSATATLAAMSLSSPLLSLLIDCLSSVRFSLLTVLNIVRSSRKLVGVT